MACNSVADNSSQFHCRTA